MVIDLKVYLNMIKYIVDLDIYIMRMEIYLKVIWKMEKRIKEK